MIFKRNILIKKFPWLIKRNQSMIISADYDGLICASFLHHHLNWKIEGYYDLKNIWVSKKGIKKKNELIWIDLNILPRQGRAIGGHIVSIEKETPQGFESSCNPNILAKINSKTFYNKYPFSTLIYLLWLHKFEVKKDLMSRLLILHSDSSWLKFQKYYENSISWQKNLIDYNWTWLFQKVNSKYFEKRIDDELYPLLTKISAISGKSKLKSKYLKIQSCQFQFNPDWDEDTILQLLNLFAKIINWTPPQLPKIHLCQIGQRQKVSLSIIKEVGLNSYIKKKRIFSYAISSPRIFNFTSFGVINKSPLDNYESK